MYPTTNLNTVVLGGMTIGEAAGAMDYQSVFVSASNVRTR